MTTIRGDAKTAPQPKPAPRSGRGGPAARVSRFFREVIAEMSKVIWPTRKELITYTIVVLAFLTIMVTLVFGMDVVFAKGVVAVFG
ncbi:MAG TPA: preprotein translocase subunit SecE [Mycobacteriales bacterium]